MTIRNFIAALTLGIFLNSSAAEKSQPFFPFCIDWHDAKKRTFEQQAAMLKELGYDGVGHIWLDNIAERIKSLDDAGLKLFQITMTVEVGPDKAPFDARFENVLQLINGRHVQFCLLVNGMKPSDQSVDGHAVEILQKMSDLAKNTDAQLLLYPHQGSWIERIEDATRVAEKVNRPNVGVMFNLCHWLRVDKNRDYKPLLKQAMPRLWAVSISGADNFDDKPGWDHYIQPLDAGTFDVTGFLSTLHELGFKGPIGLQCYGIGGDARDHLARSMAAWKKMSARQVLWEIGKADNDDREFALAPNGYNNFREDGFFVVGASDPKRDWPYVHPGPVDGWAGGTQHTFVIAFNLKELASEGECKLRIDLVDTHKNSPPELRIAVNGKSFTKKASGGAGDDSIFGNPAKGKEQRLEVPFPASLLKTGLNQIEITTTAGSWMIYDSVALETPSGIVAGGPVHATILSNVRAQPILIERNGQLRQTVEGTIRHFGEVDSARVSIDGSIATNLTLKAGTQRFAVDMPAVQKEQQVTVTLEKQSTVIASEKITLKPVRKWVIYLLPHSHVDIGYTHVQTDVERMQWSYFESAIEAARKSASNPQAARFKWNVEVLWAVDSYLKNASPEKQQKFLDAVKAGWIGLEALYGNELTGLCRPEELLRLTSCAQKLAQRSGTPIDTAMITDVPGYTWGVVPAFAHSGVKYFSMGPNGSDRIGTTSLAWGDKPFWWIGPNGRDKLLVWMTGTGYYQVFQSTDKLMGYLGALEAKNYPYDFVQVRHCLGDNGAPDVNFADKVKAWNETYAYPKLVIATASEMFHAFEKRYGDAIPKVSGDFTPYWEDGAPSSARETALNRDAAERLVQAETLWAMLSSKKYPAEEFATAWRNVVLYDEHTWGAHNSIGEPDAPFVKSQWAIKQAFAIDADKQSRDLLNRAIAERGVRGGAVESMDVFNTSAWRRTDLVTVPKDWSLAGDTVRGPGGEPVYSQRLTSGEFIFLAKDVPAFGAKRYSISGGAAFSPGSAHVNGATLATSTLKVSIDENTGAISTLRWRDLDREFVDTKNSAGLNEYLYLPGINLNDVKKNGRPKISIKESGPLVASLSIESDAPGCRKLTREVRVAEGIDRIEILNTVDKLPVRAKEGVHFGFAFDVPQGIVRNDVAWSVVQPEVDQIPGACKNWFTIQRWVDISNDDFGVTWATPDAPLIEVGGISANILGAANDPKFWRNKVEPTQRIYSWAMNNHWHTNYRADQEGPTTFRYVLQPHRQFRSDEANRFGVSITQPLVPIPAQGVDPYATPRLSINAPAVMVSAFKPSEDGKALIVRLFGAGGKTQTATLDWPNPQPAKVSLSDNSERPGPSVGNSIEVAPYTIVTLRAEFPGQIGGKAN